MGERSGGLEDELIDLNREPIERKRKRVDGSSGKRKKWSDVLPKSGRVLRSWTVAMSDGEKQEMNMEIVILDTEGSDVSVLEGKDESKVSVLMKKKKRKGKLGRPRKAEVQCQIITLRKRKERRGRPRKSEVSSLDHRKKEKRGRPLKSSKCEASSLGDHKKERRGRPRKIDVNCEASSLGEQKEIRGRALKSEGKCEVSSLGDHKKERRGRPRKIDVKCEVSSLGEQKERRGRPPKWKVSALTLSDEKKDEVLDWKRVNLRSNVIGQGQERAKVKGKRGRPRKVDVENVGLVVDHKYGKKCKDRKKSGTGVSVKRSKVSMNDSVNSAKRRRNEAGACAEGKEMARSKQQQLLRDRIVSMLKKAGWTVEYRQRQSKDYQDAVYVDRDGRTHWSVTLAYRKLKEKVDGGNAEAEDISAFSPIAEETLSMLFRKTEKGKKAGKKRIVTGMTIKKKKRNGKVESRLNQGKQRTLLARKPRDGSNSDGYKFYEGKHTLLSWMVDLGTVPLRGKVKYRTGTGEKEYLEGRILKEGICCDCCNITHTVHKFAYHAKSTFGEPYQDIYLESGNSLSQCLSDSWRKHIETDKIGFVCVDLEGDDPSDDRCNVCGDGGDLICCDSCPSTFHNSCLCIDVPLGDWYCVYCLCKFCGVACGSSSTTDDDCNFSSESCTCHLCEEKFHAQCIEGTVSGSFDDENPLFCGKECSKIFEQLQVLLGVGHQLEEEYSYTVLQHRAVGDDVSLNGDFSRVESNSKLAVAFSVMDECFQPIKDERSGTNMIHSVIYNCGSNIRRSNYEGFYTFILEKGDELVSVASVRIHGSQLAEMPFIGTRFSYRRQGMCSRLLTAIETVLSSLGVEKLVIPAISELNETWTKVFGFMPLEKSERLEMKHISMVVFPGVAMLQKPLKGQTDSTVTECTEVGAGHQNMLENRVSDSNTCSDIQNQNCGNGSDDSAATVAMAPETQTPIQSAQEKSEVNIHSDCNDATIGPGSNSDAAATKLSETQTPIRGTQDEYGGTSGGPTTPKVDTSEAKIHSNGNVSVSVKRREKGRGKET